MTVAARLAGFVVVLALAFAAAVGIGSAVGPTNRSAAETDEAHGAMVEEGEVAPQGVAIARDGFRLVAETTGFTPGRTGDFHFRIADEHGATVRDFDVEHEKRLHLIVARRDLTHYMHVHPVQQADGSWTVPLRFADAGTYRVFADFTAHGAERVTLGTDLTVPGPSRAEELPAPAQAVDVDGYRVEIAGEHELSFTVTRAGRPVVVEPYLGADVHLVTLRAGDLAYLHAHPLEGEGGGGPIRFAVEYPSAGRYRLFLQFQHEGAVHTAAFTQDVA